MNIETKYSTGLVRIVLMLLASALLVSCVKSDADLRKFIQDTKNRDPDPIEPLPKDKELEKVVYIVDALRDPFSGGGINDVVDRPDDPNVVVEGPRPDPDRRKEILEGFELDSLEMVGTFFINEINYGLIEDPDGVIHRVTVDNYMGRNHGRIVSIQENMIRLSELIPDGPNKWELTVSEIALDDG